MQMTARTNTSCILVAALLSRRLLGAPYRTAKCLVGKLTYHVVFCFMRLHSEQTLCLFLSVYQTQQIKKKNNKKMLRTSKLGDGKER